MVQWKNTGGLKQKEARMRYAWWNTIITFVSNNY